MRSQSYSDRMRDAIIGPRVKARKPSSQGEAMTQPNMASRRRKVRPLNMTEENLPCQSGWDAVVFPAHRRDDTPPGRSSAGGVSCRGQKTVGATATGLPGLAGQPLP